MSPISVTLVLAQKEMVRLLSQGWYEYFLVGCKRLNYGNGTRNWQSHLRLG